MSDKLLVGHAQIQIEQKQVTFPLYEGINIVGRNTQKSSISIKSNAISDVHAKIICQDGKVKIIDQSKNGVYWKHRENRIAKGEEIEIDP